MSDQRQKPSEAALQFASKIQNACLLDVNLHDLLQEDVARLLNEFLDAQLLNPALQSLMDERKRQNVKWGEQNHALPVWMLILTEEVGEAAQAVLKIREGSMAVEDFRTEIVHCGAVCAQILEYLSRGNVSAE